MYNKSKNGLLFAVFILIILIIVSILVISVHNTRQNDIEEYKISLNSSIYDKNYSYISLDNDAILKKEWDGNYYLYSNDKSSKYELGTEVVLYDKAKKQVNIYGTVYQVYSNGDISKKTKKTSISKLDEFQFFKLNDRKYLVVGNSITGNDFNTNNYLIVSIDKGGNALLLNNDVNIKTIHPLILSVGNNKFDIANEKLLIGDETIDLKKINGSTNEYVVEEEPEPNDNSKSDNNSNSNNNNTNNVTNNTNVYNDIIRQIINISGLITNDKDNNLNLYKNVTLRNVTPRASYIDIAYSVIDPEDKYLSVFLTLSTSDDQNKIEKYYLNKQSNSYRISGLEPNKQYEVSIRYLSRDSIGETIADSVIVTTNTDPTEVRIIEINENVFTYKVKMYNEYEFEKAYVALTNCNANKISEQKEINIDGALSQDGDVGTLTLDNANENGFVCLQLYDKEGAQAKTSYHRIKIN